MREQFKPFETRPLVSWDINRIQYRYKHFDVPSFMCENENALEVWVEGKRCVNITYLQDPNFPGMTHGILDFYTEAEECQVRYNPHVLFQYHHFQETPIGNYILELPLDDPRVKSMRDPVNNVYYISGDDFHKPIVTKTDTTIRYECPCDTSIDFYMEKDLVWCGEVTEDVSVYVDDPMSEYTYGCFILDDNSDVEIDTRFYPCILPKESGFLRLYDDRCLNCPYPAYTRVINYAENVQYYNDPYHSELFDRLPEPTTSVITSDMTDNEMLETFSAVSAYCYRWNEAPIIQNYSPVFTVLNNANQYAMDRFVEMTYHPTTDTSTTAYISSFPYEDHADIILYQGKVIYDYFIEDISFRNGEAWVDHLYGKKRYVITTEYDADDLTVLKFHSHENIGVKNLEPWLDKQNLLQLHRKVNRFWHNFIALTSAGADIYAPEDQIWVGTYEPPEIDDHLWFELMGYVDNIITDDNKKDIFPLVVSTKTPDFDELNFPSKWRQDVIHWIGDGANFTETDVFNRILYAQNELVDNYKDQKLILTSAEDGGVSFPELVSNTRLQRVYWEQPELENIEHNDIWMEWYATVKDHISYSSENTLVMHINENVYTIQFDEELEDLRIIAFDDIALNFRDWDRGVRYLSVLADLQQSDLVKPEDMMIFYDRLITTKDHFDPGLHRCKTHISNVVAHVKSEIKDFSVIYGTNICHQHWDWDSGAIPLPEGVFPEEGSIATADLPDVSHDTTYWYQWYPDYKKYRLRQGNLLLGNDREDAWPMQLYYRFLLVQNDPSDIYLNELILQQINGDEVRKSEVAEVYDHDPMWDNDQPYSITQYLAISPRTINKVKDSPKYILRHLTALQQDEYLREHRAEEGVLLTSGVVSYYARDDFSYIPGKCMVFANGKYIPESKIEQRNEYRFAITEFDEIIETVDVYYCRTDIPQMRLQHSSEQYLPEEDWIDPNLGNTEMEYIKIYEENYQGYYDVLRKDYFDNNKLLGILEAIGDDEEEYQRFREELMQQFSQITTKGLFGSNAPVNRIIMYGGGTDQRYQLFKKEGN